MTTIPLEFTFIISPEDLANSKAEAAQKPIKLSATNRTDESAPIFDRPGDPEELTLSLIVAAKAGVGYTLDDSISPASKGVVSEDGLLIHPISPMSAACKIIFSDQTAPVQLFFKQSADDNEELIHTILETEDDDIEEQLSELTDGDDDERTLSLLVSERANQAYMLNDKVSPPKKSSVDESGLLTHPISRSAKSCVLTFEDDNKSIELYFERQ